LRAGLKFVLNSGTDNIKNSEMSVIKHVYSVLADIKNVELYTNPFSITESFAPILSFNIKGAHSEEIGGILSEENIALRAGYHCAYSAHLAYKTENTGALRIAPSVFTQKNDVNLLLNSIIKIAKNKFI
jgi:cysteine desulfurase/selenocysteine lyase